MSEQPKMKVYTNGSKGWRLNGKLHRTDGPAVEWTDGSKEWRLNGKLHRTDGPAVERADGSKIWCLNGELHRTDGPAIERADGSKEWYLNDEQFSFEDYIQELKALGKEETVINLLFQLDAV